MIFTDSTHDDEYLDESVNEILSWLEVIMDEYRKSASFLTLTDIQQENATFIVKIFVENCYNYGLKKPGQWDLDILEEVCLDVFPRKISADIECFESVGPVLISFMQWAEQKSYLTKTKDFCKYIKKIANDIVERAKSPENWGIAKSMLMWEMKRMPDDSQYFSENVSRPITVNKIGRNETCPCGSGKKYKKCCLKVNT